MLVYCIACYTMQYYVYACIRCTCVRCICVLFDILQCHSGWWQELMMLLMMTLILVSKYPCTLHSNYYYYYTCPVMSICNYVNIRDTRFRFCGFRIIKYTCWLFPDLRLPHAAGHSHVGWTGQVLPTGNGRGSTRHNYTFRCFPIPAGYKHGSSSNQVGFHSFCEFI